MTKEEIEHEKLWTEGIVSAVMLSSKGIVRDFISNLEKVGYKIVKSESENERLKAEMSIDEAMLKDVDIKIIEFALDGKKWSLHSSGEYYYYDKYGSWPPSETMELSDVKNIYESEREWISVETKKPNSDRIVLVFAPDCKIIGSILIGRYYEPERGFNESWTVYDFDQSKLDQIVTHWKELPKLPKQSCPQCKTEYTKEELLTNEHCFKCGFEMKGF